MTLTEKAIAAKALGMSYGQYVAKYHPDRPQPESARKSDLEDGKLRCVNCGAELHGKQRMFCSYDCSLEYKRKPPRACTVCGKTLPVGKMKYCGCLCESQARRARRMGVVRQVRRAKVGKKKRFSR